MLSRFQPNHSQSRSMTSRFGRGVVAADEQIVVALHTRWSDHEVAVYRVQSLHDAHIGKFTLSLFAKRIGVANGQRRRHAFGSIQRVAD